MKLIFPPKKITISFLHDKQGTPDKTVCIISQNGKAVVKAAVKRKHDEESNVTLAEKYSLEKALAEYSAVTAKEMRKQVWDNFNAEIHYV